MSVRLRLTLWYAALMATTLILGSMALYVALDRNMVFETDAFLQSKARDLSARTGGVTMAQLLLGLVTPGGCSDRVLNGPTNDVWIDPWLRYLTGRGVRYRLNAVVTGIRCEAGRITGVTCTEGGAAPRTEDADHYIAAVPMEAMRGFLASEPGLAAADPQLARLGELRTSWMNGVMFYLRSAPALTHQADSSAVARSPGAAQPKSTSRESDRTPR